MGCYRGYEEKHQKEADDFRLRGENRISSATEKTGGKILMLLS